MASGVTVSVTREQDLCSRHLPTASALDHKSANLDVDLVFSIQARQHVCWTKIRPQSLKILVGIRRGGRRSFQSESGGAKVGSPDT